MFEFLPATSQDQPAPAAHLAAATVTSPARHAPARRFARLLVLALGAWLTTACASESSSEQSTTPASGAVTEETSDDPATPTDGNDECRKMQDMWDALPKLETYKQFKLSETTCLPAKRAISYKFRMTDDKEALMTVALWDENQDGNENALIKSAQEAVQATANPNGGVRKSTLGIGEIPTVLGTMMSGTAAGGKFICLFKGHYYFEILVSLSGKSLAKPEAVESYVQQYLKQIDPGKLK